MSVQIFSLAPGETAPLIFTLAANGSIAGQTFEFNLRELDGTLMLQKTSAGVVISDAGSADTPGVVTVTLSAAETGALAELTDYAWDFWRTSAGLEAQLAYGTVGMREQWRS